MSRYALFCRLSRCLFAVAAALLLHAGLESNQVLGQKDPGGGSGRPTCPGVDYEGAWIWRP